LYPVVKRKRSKKMFFTIAGLDVELPDQNARQQSAHNGPRLNDPIFSRPMKTHGQYKKDGQLGMLLKAFTK